MQLSSEMKRGRVSAQNCSLFDFFTKNILLDSFSPGRGFWGSGTSPEVLKRLSQNFARTPNLLGKSLKEFEGFRGAELGNEKRQS